MNRLLPEKRSWVLRGKLDDRFHVQFPRLHKISWCEMFLPCRLALKHGVKKKDFIDRGRRNAFYRKKRVIYLFIYFLPICKWEERGILTRRAFAAQASLSKIKRPIDISENFFMRCVKKDFIDRGRRNVLFLSIWIRKRSAIRKTRYFDSLSICCAS